MLQARLTSWRHHQSAGNSPKRRETVSARLLPPIFHKRDLIPAGSPSCQRPGKHTCLTLRLPQGRKGEAGDPEINSGSVFGGLCSDRALFQERLIYQPWRGQKCQRRSSCPWEDPKSFHPLPATPPGHSNAEPVQGSGVLPPHSSLFLL